MKINFQKIWYGKILHPVAILLLPFSLLFAFGVMIRRGLYRCGLVKIHYFPTPVIVVGNITVGGTGKTPFVIALANFLQEQGYQPGIVSRGVGGAKHKTPHYVDEHDAPEKVGDEALLLKQSTSCPIMIGVNRAEAVHELLARSNCNVVISDDGLQHYRLDRDIEIAMLDKTRGLGNALMLPAGPLRERKSRLQKTDFVVINGGDINDSWFMNLELVEFVSVVNPDKKISITDFPRKKCHAVAGIGHPHKFFQMLRNMGFDCVEHAFSDHHLYNASELDFSDDCLVIMTEKDAVKCRSFNNINLWYARAKVSINPECEQAILAKLITLEVNHELQTSDSAASDISVSIEQ